MNRRVAQTDHLFIVRISSGPDSGAPARWRGSVIHVPTQARFYFSELSALQEFIRERIRSLRADSELPG
jgi:hypothetical protein